MPIYLPICFGAIPDGPQGLFLAVFRNHSGKFRVPFGMSGIESWSAACKMRKDHGGPALILI